MQITKIEELDKKRVRIYIDGEFAFALYKGELRLHKMEEGQEMGTADYAQILEEILPKRAKLRCLNLLKARAYTERQLRDKLRQGEYPQDVIEEAVAYVKSYGYVDDRKYAEDFIACHMADRSGKRMERDLMGKGVAKEIIREVMGNMSVKGELPNEISIARKWLKKKNYNPETATNKEKQKISAFLYRKGFQMDTIRSVLLLDINAI